MLLSPTAGLVKKTVLYAITKARAFLGLEDAPRHASSWSRVGLASSGLFLVASGIWILATSERLPSLAPVSLISAGLLIIVVSARKALRLAQTNVLALTTHLSALFAFYFLTTRFLTVTYSTDTIVGTYAGIWGVLQFQNPYLYSIKPFLDQFNFPPSSYTPRVDGSFEFHLNYPAFNFLALIPLYLVGLHDLRDGILVFHVMSILLIFGLAPSRVKSIGLAPFAFGLPLAVVFSWTDSVWAFLLLLAAVAWYRDKRLGLALVGLAGATKQIALVVAPFLLIRLWHESSGSKRKRMLAGLGALLAGFIVPNLPFIISAPSAWWAGTVAAYLPSNAPQVAAGVGLSEILDDLGVSLPSYFYLAMTGAVTLGTIYLYNRRFARYKHFVWAMPALILFFYHRPFPNYIIFWLVPLLPEILRFKPGGLRWNPISFLRKPQLHQPVPLFIPRVRRRMTSSTLVAVLLAAVLAGASGAYVSRGSEQVEVQVDGVLDPDAISAATVLETTLTNLGTEPVSPRFFVKWYFLPFLWTTNSTTILPPNSNGQYIVTATDARAAVPRGTQFKLLVFNSLNGDLVGQSQILLADLPAPTIANPYFRWWTLDSETGRKVPFGWRLSMVGDDKISGIDEVDSRLGGLQLNLVHSSPTPGLREISVSQKLPFDSASLNLMVLQPPEADSWDGVVFGARITDVTHTIYFAFSTTSSQRSVSVYPENTTIIMPIVSGEWTSVLLDTSSEWATQGWPIPRSIEFTIFLHGDLNGVFYAYVREIA